MKFKAFTLIELMVVVAIMSILATMGVANFSSAIGRARNAARQNDIIAVSKSLETCFNMTGGIYWGNDDIVGSRAAAAAIYGSTGTKGYITRADGEAGLSATPFAASANDCLDQDIYPSIATYPYVILTTALEPQKYVLCAALEPVAGVEELANHVTAGLNYDLTSNITQVTAVGAQYVLVPPTATDKCPADGTDKQCWFCVLSQQ